MLPLLLGALGALAFSKRSESRANAKLSRSLRRKLGVGAAGVVTRGLPEPLLGLPASELHALRQDLVRLAREQVHCERDATTQKRRTFDRKADGTRALLDANPDLHDLLETECSWDCKAFSDWSRKGRRGPKPRLSPGDGRFDALNEGLDRRGGRRIASWLEAVHAVVPPSRRWQRFDERLPYLEAATEKRLMPPHESERLALQELERERCREGAEAAADDVLRDVRTRGRRRPSTDVPF